MANFRSSRLHPTFTHLSAHLYFCGGTAVWLKLSQFLNSFLHAGVHDYLLHWFECLHRVTCFVWVKSDSDGWTVLLLLRAEEEKQGESVKEKVDFSWRVSWQQKGGELRRRRQGEKEIWGGGEGEGGGRRRWRRGYEEEAICRQEGNPSLDHSSPSSLWHCPPLIKTHHSSGQKSHCHVNANKLNDCPLDSRFWISSRI